MNSTVLTFGPSRNARIWNRELARLGVSNGAAIMQDGPRMQTMVEFFRTPSNWVYFSGHHSSAHLRNRVSSLSSTAGVRFFRNRVEVYSQGPRGTRIERTLQKSQGFRMHTATPQVLFWGGCNVCAERRTIQVIRSLFNNPLILGYAASSGWKITHKMFTGRHIGPGGEPIRRLQGSTDFFNELSTGSLGDVEHVRNAWLRTARANYRGKWRSKFRAIDPTGQEWLPGKKERKEGREF